MSSTQTNPIPRTIAGLGAYSKSLVVLTLGLICFGGQVKSNEAGLSVPDWPTTYGDNMFLFPPSEWIGGIYYEHVHRLLASGIGFLTIILAVWLKLREPREWVRVLGYLALAAVTVQGLLGGLTVLLQLPVWVSSAHGILAQLFLLNLIAVSYTQSKERAEREHLATDAFFSPLAKPALLVLTVIFIQLFLGAVMRHMEAGLAIPDFPTTAGRAIPWVNEASVEWSNGWRADRGMEGLGWLDSVTFSQVLAHFAHRIGALVVSVVVISTTILAYRQHTPVSGVRSTLVALNVILVIQILLGIATVLTVREPILASMHVVTGAAFLGTAGLLCLRACPLSFGNGVKRNSTFDQKQSSAAAPLGDMGIEQ